MAGLGGALEYHDWYLPVARALLVCLISGVKVQRVFPPLLSRLAVLDPRAILAPAVFGGQEPDVRVGLDVVQPRGVLPAASVGGDQDDLVRLLEIQERGAADLSGLGAGALQEADGGADCQGQPTPRSRQQAPVDRVDHVQEQPRSGARGGKSLDCGLIGGELATS